MSQEEQIARVNSVIDKLASSYLEVAPIIRAMDMRPSDRIDTLCVDSYGRGLYNPKFTKSLNIMQLNFVIMHETFHVLLRHMTRFNRIKDDTRYSNIPCGMKMSIFNIAADAFINDNLSHCKDMDKVDGCIYFDTVNKEYGVSREEFDKMNSEDLYFFILDRMLDGQQGGLCQNSQGGSDSNDKPGNGSTNQQNSSVQQDSPNCNNSHTMSDDITKEDVINKEFDGSRHKSIDGLTGAGRETDRKKIDVILNSSNVDWEKILDRFVYNISGRGRSNRTWRRQSKYYRDIYPVSKGRMRNLSKDILLSIDVSGSMDAVKLSKAASIVDNMSRKYQVGMYYSLFNSCYTEDKKLSNIHELINDIRNNSGGGTIIKAALHSYNINHNGIIIITDMRFGLSEEHLLDVMSSLDIEYMFIDISDKRSINGEKSIFGDHYIRVD